MSTEGQQALAKGADFPFTDATAHADYNQKNYRNLHDEVDGIHDINELDPDVRLSGVRQSFDAKEGQHQNTSFNIPTAGNNSQSQMNAVHKSGQEFAIGLTETLNDRDALFQDDMSPAVASPPQ